eukprot:TRINITY_DN7405_c0_g1_i1.p1 TRINITY_DN7405_c0_g1~~TRINITY_DN7405_c0_g1_i1.p1  ORF type:complete len:186 (-),score=15.49 TRINITY_DN7405_c0_g1_i1:285-842(-)
MTGGLHNNIELRECGGVGGGFGLFCTGPIAAGEVLYDPVDDDVVREWTMAEIDALPTLQREKFRHFMYQVGPDSFNSAAEFDRLPVDSWLTVDRVGDASNYMNHSCDPSCWFATNGDTKMTARRDLRAGDAVTYDYATSNAFPFEFSCGCKSSDCRIRVSGNDWKVDSVQEKYAGHLLWHCVVKK